MKPILLLKKVDRPYKGCRNARNLYRCSCGAEFKSLPYSVDNGLTKSCGCFRKSRMRDRNTTHNGTYSAEFRTWSAMKSRCLNPNATGYKNYGGRGITVCQRWLGANGFNNFLEDMGKRPKSHSIDRIDCDGNYEPSNCRWATPTTQRRNRRKA